MDAVDFYAGSWTAGDPDGTRRMIAPHAEIAWNLAAPVDDEELVQTLQRIAAFADRVELTARVNTPGGGATLLYDLVAPFGTAKLAEFVTVTDDRITDVRQVYDVVAIDRYFPGLYEIE